MADGCLHNTTDRASTATLDERKAVEDMAVGLVTSKSVKSYTEFRKAVLDERSLGHRFEQYAPEIWAKAKDRLAKENPEALASIDDSASSYIDYRFFEYASDTEAMGHINEAMRQAAESGVLRLRKKSGQTYQDLAASANRITLDEATGQRSAVNEALIVARQQFRTELTDRLSDLSSRIEQAEANRKGVMGDDARAILDAEMDSLLADSEQTQSLLSAVVAAEAGDATSLGRALSNLRQIASARNLGVAEAIAHTEVFSETGPMNTPLKGGSEGAAKAAKKGDATAIRDIMDAEVADADAAKPARKKLSGKTVAAPKKFQRSTGVKTLLGAFAKIRREKGLAESRAALDKFKAENKISAREFWESIGIDAKGNPQAALNDIMDRVVSLGIDKFPDAYKVVRDLPAMYMSTDFWIKKPDGTFSRRNHIEAFAEAFEAKTGVKPTASEKAAMAAATAKLREGLQSHPQDNYYDIPNKKDVLFHGPSAKVALENIRETYREPASRERRTGTGDELNYLGGYVYERIYRENGNRPPSFSEWVSTVKALTGVDIAPKDYADTWSTMKAWSNHHIVKPRIDIKRKALRDASVRMTAEQLADFKKRIDKLDPEDPNFPHQRQAAYEDIMNTSPGALEVLREAGSIMRMLAFSNDFSVVLTHLPIMALDPRRLKQVGHVLKSGLGAMARPEVYEALMAHQRDASDPMYVWREKYFRNALLDVHQRSNELFSSNFIHRLADLSYQGKTTSVISRRRGMANSSIKKAVPQLFNPEFGVQFEHPKKGLGFIDTQAIDTVRGGTDIGVDINPLAQVSRTWAASERGWNAAANLARSAMFDEGFKRLQDMGYDPNIHEQVYQSMADTVGMMTGTPNLSKGTEPITRFLSHIFGAPKYTASIFQVLGRPFDIAMSAAYDQAVAAGKVSPVDRNRIEAYLPSTIDANSTEFHASPSQRLYNSRYVPPEVRKQFANSLAGYAAGFSFVSALAILSGGEVTIDPNNDNHWRVAYPHFSFGLPGFPIANTIKTITQLLSPGYKKSDGKPVAGLVTPFSGRKKGREFVPYASTFGSRTAIDKARMWVEGKAAPLPRTVAHNITGYNSIGQKVYWRRLQNDKGEVVVGDFSRQLDNALGIMHDVWSDTGTLSPTDAFNVLSEKDANLAEKTWGALALLGTPNKPTKFKPDPYYHKE